MYEVKVFDSFSSGHHLREYDGQCEMPHGHNWRVEVICRSETLNSIGIVLDFKILKQRLKIILDDLDHVNINDLTFFKDVNPSSENIAHYIYDKLKLDNEITEEAEVFRVNVWETDRSCASYYE